MTTTTRTTDLLREVVRADPEFHRDKTRVVEYEFGKNGERTFVGNPSQRGAYAPEE